MKHVLIATLSLLHLTPLASGSNEPDLTDLHTALHEARSQAGLNAASEDIAQHWNKRLTEIEARIITILDDEGRNLFANSQEAWRAHRIAHSRFLADSFRGGTVQPLVYNSVLGGMTEQRVEELNRYLRELLK